MPRAVSLISLLLVLFSSAASARPERGYKARACGFDLDDDGVVGEAVDDCRLCDGLTLDPDGDGVNEDLIYVDADSGSDTTGNGSPGNPFKTIRHAWGTFADGPADGAEDVVCFRGTAREEAIRPGVKGVAGTTLRPRSGSEARDFELPRDPTLLVGWDFDRDGCYPPYDDGVTDVARCGTDADTAVLDGFGLTYAFVLNQIDQPAAGYLEMAHFAARDYGRGTAVLDTGFVDLGRSKSSEPSHHLYLHDLELDGINQGKALDGKTIAFDFFVGSMPLHHLVVENLAVRDVGSYFARGSFSNEPLADGPIRFQNLTLTAHGCTAAVCGQTNGATVTGFKLWGVLSGFELLDSVVDANLDAWEPRSGGPVNAFVADACLQDVVVRNNFFHDWWTALTAKGADAFCTVRPVDDLLFDGNQVVADHVSYSQGLVGAIGIELDDEGKTSPEASLADVTVINNFFSSRYGWRYGLLSEAGNETGEPLGTVTVAGNTFHGPPAVAGWGIVHLRPGKASDPVAFPLSRFRIFNNVFTGFGAKAPFDAVIAEYRPNREMTLARNTYDPVATFRYLGTSYPTLDGWRTATGLDAGSRPCVPTLVDPLRGDLHLHSLDTCTGGIGGDLSALTSVDIDGDPRPAGTARAGADENDSLFAEGFESGNLSRWSATAGLM